MLLMKTKYALIALSRLAKEFDKDAILISDIAAEEKIPQRFLENILQELKKIRVVGSKRGKNGGYFLKKNPKEITLLEIIQYLEGSIGLLNCISETQYQPCEFCKNEETCNIREPFRKIRNYTIQTFKNTTFADLVDNKPTETTH